MTYLSSYLAPFPTYSQFVWSNIFHTLRYACYRGVKPQPFGKTDPKWSHAATEYQLIPRFTAKRRYAIQKTSFP